VSSGPELAYVHSGALKFTQMTPWSTSFSDRKLCNYVPERQLTVS